MIYQNLFMQCTDILFSCKKFIGKNLTSTHNVCFGSKIGIPLQTPVFLYKSGVKGGIHFMDS